ncbi:hypothetical protein WME90_44135 [Sorangium sp. So ce375]|uniref:hypothetical protein n=1 Tax=Sorangium sp. So ce375 TaxID=3133306 RepID=UPI003F5C2717
MQLGGGAAQRPPHPATVAQRREAPFGGAKALPPHPATVAQRREAPFGGAKALPPHPATVAQRREAPFGGAKTLPPHPATVAQRREAPFGGAKTLPPHPATVAQRREAPFGGAKTLPPHPALARRAPAGPPHGAEAQARYEAAQASYNFTSHARARAEQRIIDPQWVIDHATEVWDYQDNEQARVGYWWWNQTLGEGDFVATANGRVITTFSRSEIGSYMRARNGRKREKSSVPGPFNLSSKKKEDEDKGGKGGKPPPTAFGNAPSWARLVGSS